MLEKFYQYAAPLGTPFPTALTVAGVLYQDVQATLPAYLALIAAIFGFFGFEAVGGLCTYAFVRMLRTRQSPFTLYASFLGLVVYFLAGVMLLHGYAVAWFLPLTPFAYIAWASFRDIQEAEAIQADEARRDLDTLKARRLLVNAETRQINATNATETPRNAIKTPDGADPQTRAKELFQSNPSFTAKRIGEIVDVPTRTAQRWVREWKREVTK